MSLKRRALQTLLTSLLACGVLCTPEWSLAEPDSTDSTLDEGPQTVFELNANPARADGAIAPIITSLQRVFDKCARLVTGQSGLKTPCHFENLGVLPAKAHCKMNPVSCHSLGRAIDIGAISCGKMRIEPSRHQELFNSFAKCILLAEEDYHDTQRIQIAAYSHASEATQELVKKQGKGATLLKSESEYDHLHLQLSCGARSEPPRHACSGSP